MKHFIKAPIIAKRLSNTPLLLLVIAFSYTFSTQFAHAEQRIDLDTLSGSVSIQRDDGSWSNILPPKLKLPIAIKTGDNSKATISQGDTSITINANTEIEIDKSETRQGNIISLIKQRLGNAIYKVEKHSGDFKVETPYLVSVVKGTRFSVFTDNSNSFVSVTEGLVEVSDLATGEVQDLYAGDIAKSASAELATQARSLILHAAARSRSTSVRDSESIANTSNSTGNPSASRANSSAASKLARSKKPDALVKNARAAKEKHSLSNKSAIKALVPITEETLDDYASEERYSTQSNALGEANLRADKQSIIREVLSKDADARGRLIERIESRIQDSDTSGLQGIIDIEDQSDNIAIICANATPIAIANASPNSALALCN